MSVASNRPLFLWWKVQKDLKLGEYRQYGNDDIVVVSYYLRKNSSQKKIVNFISNIDNCNQDSSVYRYNKKLKCMERQEAPMVINLYRRNHGFVDRRKQIESHVRNKQRALYAWRSKLNNIFYVLLSNCYVWFKSVKKFEKKYSFPLFLRNLLPQLREQHKNTFYTNTPIISNDNHSIVYHPLSNEGNRGKCEICGKWIRRECLICKKPTGKVFFLHEGVCNLKFHNPNINIIDK
jgi:hypothetical protein